MLAIGLPASLFADAPEKLVTAWLSRGGVDISPDFATPKPARLTLLAALCPVHQAGVSGSFAHSRASSFRAV
jgi:hypothetical protein